MSSQGRIGTTNEHQFIPVTVIYLQQPRYYLGYILLGFGPIFASGIGQNIEEIDVIVQCRFQFFLVPLCYQITPMDGLDPRWVIINYYYFT